MNSSNYALILAGGSGTRFWPLSRNERPKQLLPLFKGTTLLAQTIERLEGLIPRENIFILTNQLQKEEVLKEATMLPVENIFAEPMKRDTAPAVALGIALVAARDPQATMMVVPADQRIEDKRAYQEVMGEALSVAGQTDALVTIGIKPTWACPSYGYIEKGDIVSLNNGLGKKNLHRVSRFREKPDKKQAQLFLDQGGFVWNAGMFIWSIPTVLNELKQQAPELEEFIRAVQAADNVKSVVDQKFPELTPISIDYALMEHAEQVLNIEATFDWDDVGSWNSVAKYLQFQEKGNASNVELVNIESEQNIVFQEEECHKIALLGVENLIVVQTKDALLIANKDDADSIKKIVDLLPCELR